MTLSTEPPRNAADSDNRPAPAVGDENRPTVGSVPDHIDYAVTTADGLGFYSRDDAVSFTASRDAHIVGVVRLERDLVTVERIDLWAAVMTWAVAVAARVLLTVALVLAVLGHLQIAAASAIPGAVHGGAAWLSRAKRRRDDSGPP